MDPDLVLLRELIESSTTIKSRRDCGVPEAWILEAEAVVGPLPRSYRWWLAEYGDSVLSGSPIATIAPPHLRADAHDDITAPWRLNADRLCFYAEPDCGDTYHFDRRSGGQLGVLRRDHSGAEELMADSFAGFLTVSVAQAMGLGTGHPPALARLWRSTPGVLLPNGVLVYGPHTIGERNETYEVAEYAPDWLLIGDDSGGSGLFMRRHGADRASVYRLDLGAIENYIDGCGVSERLTDDLLAWLPAVRGG